MDPRADLRKRPTHIGRMYAGTEWAPLTKPLNSSSVSHTETKQGGTAGNAGPTADSSLSNRTTDLTEVKQNDERNQ